MAACADKLRARLVARETPTTPAITEIDELAKLLEVAWTDGAGCHDYTAARLRRLIDGASGGVFVLRDRRERLVLTIYLDEDARWGFVADLEASLELFSGEPVATALFERLVALAHNTGAAAASAHSCLDLALSSRLSWRAGGERRRPD